MKQFSGQFSSTASDWDISKIWFSGRKNEWWTGAGSGTFALFALR
jgi:hypothetical protein